MFNDLDLIIRNIKKILNSIQKTANENNLFLEIMSKNYEKIIKIHWIKICLYSWLGY